MRRQDSGASPLFEPTSFALASQSRKTRNERILVRHLKAAAIAIRPIANLSPQLLVNFTACLPAKESPDDEDSRSNSCAFSCRIACRVCAGAVGRRPGSFDRQTKPVERRRARLLDRPAYRGRESCPTTDAQPGEILACDRGCHPHKSKAPRRATRKPFGPCVAGAG